MEKLIITAALSGAEVTKAMNPCVPYTKDEFVREAVSACEAGASILHLHVRWDDGTPTQDKARFEEIIGAIRAACPDVIIQPSTGGAVGMSNDERLQPTELAPEMATLDCGTLNFGGDEIFENTENTIIYFAQRMKERGIKPELEVFDKSMIDMALRLARRGLLLPPLHFDFVMGVNGGISGDIRDFAFLRGSIPPDATYTVAGIGRYEFPLAALAIIDGGHVRVGLEDNVYLSKGVPARSNGELVAKAVRLANELGRAIASPADARRILKI
jgi:3-keto-5-aminohexanoate cleavage enzyme